MAPVSSSARADDAHAAWRDPGVTDSDGDGIASVFLNGTASSDPDGGISGYDWREGPQLIGAAFAFGIPLSVGVHTITLIVWDDDGASGSDTVVITVTAAAAPPPLAARGDREGSGTVTGSASSGSVLIGTASRPLTIRN
jgi:hypothetical protein